MSNSGNLCGTAQKPYYLENFTRLEVLADEIGKQISELETRIGNVLSSGDGPIPTSPEAPKETRGPMCALDEKMADLVGRFSVRRNDLTAILRRIQL